MSGLLAVVCDCASKNSALVGDSDASSRPPYGRKLRIGRKFEGARSSVVGPDRPEGRDRPSPHSLWDMAAKKVAILGAGMIGDVHRGAAMLAGAQVLGVMASTPERSREVAEAWGVEQAYGSIEEVSESKAEVVHICTPNASHVPYAVALMQAGKHVLCEKPLGVSLEDAQYAAKVAEDAGVVNTIPFAYRFHPMAREMRARVQAEEFGAINLMHGSYLQDWLLNPKATSWRVDPKAGGTIASLR